MMRATFFGWLLLLGAPMAARAADEAPANRKVKYETCTPENAPTELPGVGPVRYECLLRSLPWAPEYPEQQRLKIMKKSGRGWRVLQILAPSCGGAGEEDSDPWFEDYDGDGNLDIFVGCGHGFSNNISGRLWLYSPRHRRFITNNSLGNVYNPQPGDRRGEINFYFVDNCCDSWIDSVRFDGKRVIRLRTLRSFASQKPDALHGYQVEFIRSRNPGRIIRINCYNNDDEEHPVRISCNELRKRVGAEYFIVPPRNY